MYTVDRTLDLHLRIQPVLCFVTQSCLTLLDPMDCRLPGSSVHGDSPGKNTGVGCHALLQGTLPTQGLNPDLPHCRWILYHLSQQGSPKILEWIAYPFSRGFSRPRNQTGVSCIAGRFFTSWTTRKSHPSLYRKEMLVLLSFFGAMLLFLSPNFCHPYVAVIFACYFYIKGRYYLDFIPWLSSSGFVWLFLKAENQEIVFIL